MRQVLANFREHVKKPDNAVADVILSCCQDVIGYFSKLKSIKAKLYSTLAAAGFVASLAGPGDALALPCIAASNGLWNNAVTWLGSCGGTFPGPADDVSIGSSFAITVPSSTFQVRSISMDGGAALTGLGAASKIEAVGGIGSPNSLFSGKSFPIVLTDVEVDIGPNRSTQVLYDLHLLGSSPGSTLRIRTTNTTDSSISSPVTLSAASKIVVEMGGYLSLGSDLNGVTGSQLVNNGNVRINSSLMTATNMIIQNAGNFVVPASNTFTLSPLTSFIMGNPGSTLSGAGTIAKPGGPLTLSDGVTSIANLTATTVVNIGTTMAPGGIGVIG